MEEGQFLDEHHACEMNVHVSRFTSDSEGVVWLLSGNRVACQDLVGLFERQPRATTLRRKVRAKPPTVHHTDYIVTIVTR